MVSSLPDRVAPMLATPGEPPQGDGWSVEFKWDGVRAVVAVADGRVRVWSRNGNDVTAGYPELAPLADAWSAAGPLLLDGELVALDRDGRPDFGRLQQRMHVRQPGPPLLEAVPVTLYVFDLLHHDGASLVSESYDTRRAALTALGLAHPGLQVPPATTDIPAAQLLAVAREHGLEGIVAKRRTSRYDPGRRSPAWVKTPLISTQEVLIGGWTTGQGRRAGMIGALLLGVRDPTGRLRYLGHVGTGFTDTALRTLAAQLAPLSRPDVPFNDDVPAAEARAAHWVAPVLVGEVIYRTLTRDQRLRHAAWRGLRPDRDPDEIVLDLP